MATQLVFSSLDPEGKQLVIRVDKTPVEVFKEWTRAGGLPFALEREDGSSIYVNPSAVAFWEEASDEPGEPDRR